MFQVDSLRLWCAEWLSVIVLFSLPLDSACAAGEHIDSLLSDPANYWSPGLVDPVAEALHELPLIEDNNVEPVQMLAPQRRPGTQLAQRQQSSSDSTRESGLASVPFMIGDTGAGSCASFSGFLIDADLSHPTMACGRLNIAENNTPIPTDRLYLSYRHFQNATPVRVFQFERDYNIDRFTLGGEHTFNNGLWSMEMRLPLDNRMTSDFSTVDRALGDGTFDIFDGTRTEFGNVSMIFKALMVERSDYALSAGLGITLPTSQDFHYSAEIVDFIFFPDFPDFTTTRSILVDVVASNETVYLNPFLSWVYQPTSRFFHQGFLQVEVAGNPSHVKVTGDGFNTFFDGINPPVDTITVVPAPGRAELIPQTLLRLNLGFGYILSQNPQADWINQLTALFEVHYTTTLNDASIKTIPEFTFDPLGGVIVTDIIVGNRNNQVDIVNFVAGLSANMGNWVVTNGVTAPVSQGTNRGFDFEYNLQLQRIF